MFGGSLGSSLSPGAGEHHESESTIRLSHPIFCFTTVEPSECGRRKFAEPDVRIAAVHAKYHFDR